MELASIPFFHIYTLGDEGKIWHPSVDGCSVRYDTRLLLSAPSMGILLPLEHLHSSSLTVNIIPPHILVKHSKHLRHWLQYCYHAICTQWYSALLKSESLKFHFLFLHCSVLHSVTGHIPSKCLFSSSSKRQREVKKLAECIWNKVSVAM